DALLLASDAEDRIAINIGGIANLTIIPRRSAPQDVVAFDSGPGNMLIDAFVRRRTEGREHFDRDGKYGRARSVNEETLAAMSADPYFALPPPKSTGRERFGEQFLQAHAARLEALSMEDGAATLAALTAATLASAVQAAGVPRARVVVSGGGAKNGAIMQQLQRRLSGHVLETSDAMGLPPDAK